ncbi:MAG: hypothetical protein WCR91_01190 [Sphaerochaetaceae bacterium]
MNKRLITVICIVGLITCYLPGANLLELSVRETIAATGAQIDAGNRIFLGRSAGNVVIAYQGADGKTYLSRSPDNRTWSSSLLEGIPHGAYLQGLAAAGSQVVVGYAILGQIFTISSIDEGLNFSVPVAVTPPQQNASIQDMAIDERGVIHIMFHRHNSYWDYNYARSEDTGKSYRTSLDFTGYTDSNSTGYSGCVQAAHGNLYTLYQDNNDAFAVKLGVSKDSGESWTITRLGPSSGGRLSLAANPQDPDLLYIAAFNNDGLTIIKITEATSSSPKFSPVYGDGNLVPHEQAVVSIHIAIAQNQTLTVIYLHPVTGSYSLLSSHDGGNSWEKSLLSTTQTPTNFLWNAELLPVADEFLFARSDGRGNIIVHGPEIGAKKVQVYTPDPDGFIELQSMSEPFGIAMTLEMPMILFSIPQSGMYDITHLDQETIPLYFALYDPEQSLDIILAENYDGSTVSDNLRYNLNEGILYLLALIILDDTDLGQTSRFSITNLEKEATAIEQYKSSAPMLLGNEHHVAAGMFNSFVISSSGQVFATGLNSWGQFADGSTEYKKTFSPLVSNMNDVVSGHGHTLYISNDRILYASGRNVDGQIGDGTKQERLSLFKLADDVVSAAAGYGHTLFVKTDGSVWALGANTRGQLGDGTTIAKTQPVKIFDGAHAVFSNNRNSSFILASDGSLYGFGDNDEGQLGLGQQSPILLPTFITDHVAYVAGGSSHTLLLLQDGSVMASGRNVQGQLGTGNTETSYKFTKVAERVKDITVCDHSSFLLMENGMVRASGSNKYGEFGTDSTKTLPMSTQFVLVFEDAADISGGKSHVVVLKKDGTIWTTGLNDNYQLGDTSQGFRTKWRTVFDL